MLARTERLDEVLIKSMQTPDAVFSILTVAGTELRLTLENRPIVYNTLRPQAQVTKYDRLKSMP